MKKRGFIITEVIFSLVLAASVAAVTVLAVDLKTDQFHLDRFNPFKQESSETVSGSEYRVQDEESQGAKESSKEEKPAESSPAEVSKETPVENSKESSKEASKDESKSESSENTESSDESSSESSTESDAIKLRAQPEELSEQPEELVKAMGAYGFDVDSQLNGNKLIMVDTVSSGSLTRAIVYCFEKSDSGIWWNIIGDGQPISGEAYIGENGSGFEPERDSRVTPGGIYYAGPGFYIGDKPETTYELFKITEDTYWVTDPESSYYNQRVEGTDNKDWTKADHMITSDKSYKLGLTTSYNSFEPDSSLACEIFICCGNTPTEGSIAMPEDAVKAILKWLDEGSTVNIFVNI